MVVERLPEMKLLKELVEARYHGAEQPKVSFRTIHKIVKKAAIDNGWNIFDQRTDKRRKEHRISYWRNGWRVPEGMKDAIKSQVIRDLKQGNLPGRVSWYEAISWRGPYDKLVIDNLPFKQYQQGKEDDIHKLKKELQHIRSLGLHVRGSPEHKRMREIQNEIERTRQKD